MPVLQELSDYVPSNVAAAACYNHFHAANLPKILLGARLYSLLVGTLSRYMVPCTPSMLADSIPTDDSFPTIVRALPPDRASASEDFKRCPAPRLVARMEIVSAANTKQVHVGEIHAIFKNRMGETCYAMLESEHTLSSPSGWLTAACTLV